jgi:hypothetical protein
MNPDSEIVRVLAQDFFTYSSLSSHHDDSHSISAIFFHYPCILTLVQERPDRDDRIPLSRVMAKYQMRLATFEAAFRHCRVVLKTQSV